MEAVFLVFINSVWCFMVRMTHGTQDFQGRSVHIVQIGLGTNLIFIQNVASPRDWDEGLDWILHIVKGQNWMSSLG